MKSIAFLLDIPESTELVRLMDEDDIEVGPAGRKCFSRPCAMFATVWTHCVGKVWVLDEAVASRMAKRLIDCARGAFMDNGYSRELLK
ncbi:hypothetical protein NQT62_07330 [Limnobacter humi]|uniref:Uncharacterized protein n=1 Tax=Limnobacter humi TaxID=1778671 RepID=A0ABT1WFE7_9BURK|nr:hypothetical protein [Limnobacter humi]MCQ8896245.1 hypothetical protein [Limnobacter humi]